MGRINIFITVAAALVLSNLCAAQPVSSNTDCPSPEELQRKYAEGCIYLTYIPLNDLTQLLNDKEKFDELCKQPPGRQILTVFRSFLNQHREVRLNQALAFLQLNLLAGKGGYKEMSDQDGAIKAPAWTKEEVHGIGCFCDRFLGEMVAYANTFVAIEEGTMPLINAWQEIRRVQINPMIAKHRAATMTRAFGFQVKSRTGELNALRRQNPDAFNSIDQFRQRYEQSFEALNRDARRDERSRAILGDQSALENMMQEFARFEEKKDVIATKSYIESSENRELSRQGEAQLKETIERQPLLLLLERQQPQSEERDGREERAKRREQ